MSIAIPVCTGLFYILQEVFCHKDKSRNQICLSPTLNGFFNNFCWLTTDLVSRPTQIAELISDQESYTNGACDVGATGMG